MSVVRRHPLASFVALAYVLSWWPWPLYAAGLSPSPIIGFGPFLAAVIVLAVTGGSVSVVALLARMVQWRVAPVWYATALLLPLAVAVAATLLTIASGAPPPPAGSLEGRDWVALVPLFFALLLVPGAGGAWEEPGWRGYALPRLLAGRSALVASLLVGVVWALWHVPLLVAGTVPWSDLVLIIAVSVVYTWLLHSTHGSVLLVMVFHAAMNTFGGGFFSPMFSGGDAARHSWLLAALWVVAAVVVVAVAGPERLTRRPPQPPRRSQSAMTGSRP